MQKYFMQEYIDVIKKYAVISGRASRREYWMFVLYNVLVEIAVAIVGGIIHARGLVFLYCLFIFIPGICVAIRRLHDIGRSGWWLLIALIPLAGAIVLLVFYCLDSEKGENQYGPHSKVVV